MVVRISQSLVVCEPSIDHSLKKKYTFIINEKGNTSVTDRLNMWNRSIFFSQNRLGRRGFTLIELLTVIAIISIMVSVVIGISSMVKRKSMVARTQASLEHMALALNEYKLLNGLYPDYLTNIVNYLPDSVKIQRDSASSDGKLRDIWGREFQYSPRSKSKSYELYSTGPLEDTAADNIYSGK